jgi:vesicle transport protein SEC22
LVEYKQQSKLVFRRLTPQSEPACSIESGAYTLQYVPPLEGHQLTHTSYLIASQVVYLCICDASYPRKLAFSYLDELSKEFQTNYEGKIEAAQRPYAFMGFGESNQEVQLLHAAQFGDAHTPDTFISKTARLYRDTRTAQATGAAGHMDKLNEDLQDVTRIMTKNMEDLLWRGDSLDRELTRGV